MAEPLNVVAAVLAPVSLVAAVALLVTPAWPQHRVSSPPRERADARGSFVALVGASAVTLMVSWMVVGTTDPAVLIAVGGAAATGAVVVAGVLRRLGASPITAVTLGGLAVGGALAVIAALQLAVVPSLLERTLGALDVGGALPRIAAPAAILCGLLLVARPRPECAAADALARPRRAWLRGGAGAMLAALGVAAGAIGNERGADAASGILIAVAAGAALGAISWMLVVRIAGRPALPLDTVAGALVGSSSVVLVLPALVPVAVGATAVIAGLVGGAARGARRPGLGASVGILAGLAAGGAIVGLLAEGIGFAATGGLGQSLAQVFAVIVVGLIGGVVGALCGGVVRLTGRGHVARGAAPATDVPHNDNSPGEPGL